MRPILSKIRKNVRLSVPKYGESGKTRPVPLDSSQGFATFSDLLGSDRNTGFHPGTGLVVDGDSVIQLNPTAHPPRTLLAPLTPFGRIGLQGMCSGPADPPSIFSGIYRIGSKSPGRTVGDSHQRCAPGEGSIPSSVTSPPGWNQSHLWSA